jgi:hypothetical protein
MAPAIAYTLKSFAEHLMKDALRSTAGEVGWTNTERGGDYQRIIDATLVKLGVATIEEVTSTAQLRKLEAAGAVFAWRAVVAETASDHDWTEAGVSIKREQVYQHAKEMLAMMLTQYTEITGETWFDPAALNTWFPGSVSLPISETFN